MAAPCPGIQQPVPRSPGSRLLTLCPDLFQGGQEIQLCLLLQGLGSVDLFFLWVAETKDIWRCPPVLPLCWPHGSRTGGAEAADPEPSLARESQNLVQKEPKEAQSLAPSRSRHKVCAYSGQGCTHLVPIHRPWLCQAQVGMRLSTWNRYFSKAGQNSSSSASSQFCVSFVLLFFSTTQLVRWFPGSVLCQEPCPALGEGRSQPWH